MGRQTEAEQVFKMAIETSRGVLLSDPKDIYTQDALAWTYTHQGRYFFEHGTPAEAEKCFQSAIDIRRELKEKPEHLAAFAELVGTCPVSSLQDYDVAVTMIKAAIGMSPQEARYHHIAALVYIEVKKPQEAKTALDLCLLHRIEERAEDQFALAIIHHLLEDAESAETAFDQGLDLLNKKTPGRIEPIRLRATAAGLIGIQEPAAEETP
jgi:tetratricopeptide (TPR) repeat protein